MHIYKRTSVQNNPANLGQHAKKLSLCAISSFALFESVAAKHVAKDQISPPVLGSLGYYLTSVFASFAGGVGIGMCSQHNHFSTARTIFIGASLGALTGWAANASEYYLWTSSRLPSLSNAVRLPHALFGGVLGGLGAVWGRFYIPRPD